MSLTNVIRPLKKICFPNPREQRSILLENHSNLFAVESILGKLIKKHILQGNPKYESVILGLLEDMATTNINIMPKVNKYKHFLLPYLEQDGELLLQTTFIYEEEKVVAIYPIRATNHLGQTIAIMKEFSFPYSHSSMGTLETCI